MATYAESGDVLDVLGSLRDRLPSFIVVASYLNIAHSTVLDRLSKVYPTSIPTFDGDGLEIVKYAEAKIAAAEILEAIRVNLPDLGDAPKRMRESAYEALDDGVTGYPPGSTDEGVPGTSTTVPGPRMSSFTPLSAFDDPYAAARDGSRFQ